MKVHKSWNCPAGMAYRVWAMRILSHRKLDGYEKGFLKGIATGKLHFTYHNRLIFRGIAERAHLPYGENNKEVEEEKKIIRESLRESSEYVM